MVAKSFHSANLDVTYPGEQVRTIEDVYPDVLPSVMRQIALHSGALVGVEVVPPAAEPLIWDAYDAARSAVPVRQV